MDIPKPKYKIGDIVVIGHYQEVVTEAYYDYDISEWIYVTNRMINRESDILYKL